MAVAKKSQRKDDILQALAGMLESGPGERITTAKLANVVGVSEAALYRHFPSKARMFEGLIEYTEEALFSRISLIAKEDNPAQLKCQKIALLILSFADKNAGLCRLLNGEALSGENSRLRERVSQLFNRIETQVKQILKYAEVEQKIKYSPDVASRANLLMAFIEGRIHQFVRTNFLQSPLASFEQQWPLLEISLLSHQR